MGMINPNFVGARLKEAREARGWNRVQLAEALGLTRQAVSLYENGDRSPTTKTLDLAATCLRFPVHRFVQPVAPTCDAPLFFRSFTSATKTARTRAQHRLGWVRNDIGPYLQESVDFPSVNFPKIELPDDPSAIDLETIETVATEVRRYWGLGDGPLSDVVLLLENNGAIVAQQELGVNNLDAFSRWDSADERPYIVLGTDKASAVRSRMNAAHELGHMVLHRHIHPSVVTSKDMPKLLEKQAKYFAGAFLMPAKTFIAEIPRPNLNAFVAIKTRWRVAIQAMIVRARHLEVISHTGAERLFAYLSQRGWRKQEPYDDEITIEKPRLLKCGFDLILRAGLATKASIETDVMLYASDIESAIGLEPEYFGDDVANFKFPGSGLSANR